MSNATTRNLRVVASTDGTVTRASARDIRAALRAVGAPEIAEQVTGATIADDVCDALSSVGVAYTRVAATALTPAQRGAYTRKTNTHAARRAARKATSTGFMRAYISARKNNPALTADEFHATWVAEGNLASV